MKILVTGTNGLLGQKIISQLLSAGTDFLATSIGENRNPDCPATHYLSLDITNEQEIQNACSSYRPTVVINTAAMTNVDACEEDELNCRNINVTAVGLLFEACKKYQAHFVHVSTDFVFDGENGPYREDDKPNPLSIYAKSKVDSENILLNDSCKNWSILRTIIVFGEGNNLSRSNIVLWAKSALESGKPLSIVNDQFRAPTWADDLAWACLRAGDLKAPGIFHISGPETFSIYELVMRIAAFHGFDTGCITPVSSANLNQKAKRPAKTGFHIDKAREVLGFNPKTLEESLSALAGGV